MGIFHAEVANETVSIGVKGKYTTAHNEPINLDEEVQYMLHNTKLYRNNTKHGVPNYTSDILNTPLSNVTITMRGTNDAIDYWSRGMERDVIALNFASAKNPGGGFLRGICTQEETLARSSLLYKSLVSDNTYYKINRENAHYGLYDDICIYSTKVPFIRDMSKKEEPLIYPTFADVITCPAVNVRSSRRFQIDKDTVYKAMYSRIKFIFRIAFKSIELHDYKNPVLILGAYGCGAFKNDPMDVATIFKLIMQELKYKIDEYNLVVDFAIPGGVNYTTFLDVMGPYMG